MPDLMISASSPEAGIAVVATITTDLVREVRRRHDLAPTATAAVGRLTTGAVLFGSSLKGRERVSLSISGDGPIESLTADVWLHGDNEVAARGYARHPHADIALNARGKFDVAGVIGSGTLQVTKSYEIGQPYNGVVPLYSGEIAEDIASYLVNSEQIPSVVALGVLANPEGVAAAGGVLAQVLPGADDKAVQMLEARALQMPPVTKLIAEGADAQGLLNALMGDLPLRSQRSIGVGFGCLCTAEKVETALLGLGYDGLMKLADERDEIEATCEFCRKRYVLTPEEVRALAAQRPSTGSG